MIKHGFSMSSIITVVASLGAKAIVAGIVAVASVCVSHAADLSVGDVFFYTDGDDGDGYKEHALFRRTLISYNDAYETICAAVPVYGATSEKDVVPRIAHITSLESDFAWVKVFSDKALFDKVAKPVWNRKDDWDERWGVSTEKLWYEWDKDIWPNGRAVNDRYWILVAHSSSEKRFSRLGLAEFRISARGAGNWSDEVTFIREPPVDEINKNPISAYMRDLKLEKEPIKQLFGFTIDGEVFSAPQMRESGSDYSGDFKTKTELKLKIPGAGRLRMSIPSELDGHEHLSEDVLSVIGKGVLSDREWEEERLREDFLSDGYDFCRRIDVSQQTTLTFSNYDYGLVLGNLSFFPADEKSVNINVSYASPTSRDEGYFRGYVTGAGVYTQGETVFLNAIPGEGESFSHWETTSSDLIFTDSQRTAKNLSFVVTAAMCGDMEDEAQIFIRAVWRKKCRVSALPSIVGAGTVTGSGGYYEGETVTLTATPAKGCFFTGWSDGVTTATRTITVNDEDTHVIYACFEAPDGIPPEEGSNEESLPSAASVYDGYFMNSGKVLGTIQAKVAKPKLNKKTNKTEAKVTVTIQLVGEKKITVKGDMDAATGVFTGEAKDGRMLSLTFDMDGVSGDFAGIEVVGNRNLFSSKDKAEKAEAETMLAPWLGAMNMVCDGGVLTVTIAKKGKVTVKGTIDGNKVSATTQALIGEDAICIPVAYSKKNVTLAFSIWLPIDGSEAEVQGLDNAYIGKPGTLVDGASFYVDGDILEDIPTAIDSIDGYYLFPDGESVSVSKKKWVVADNVKAAKVTYKKGEFTIAPGKKGAEIVNPSQLKLSYKSKDGSFTGSFYVYILDDCGKFKKLKASITGVLIDGIGYGTATIKKYGSWSVVIE